MISTERVTAACADDGVATVEMRDAPGKNALSEPFVAELLVALAEVAACERARVVVLLGLPEVFCSGASREVLAQVLDGAIVPSDLQLAREVLDLPLPVIAAMEGHAIGGGLALGLCADLVLIARESRYGCSFMNMGFTPGMGLTRLLEQVVAPTIAHEMLYSGEAVKGARFEGRSTFNDVLPRAQVRERAFALAARIAEKPRPALVALKRVLSQPKREAFEASRSAEALLHQITLADRATVRQLIEEHFDA